MKKRFLLLLPILLVLAAAGGLILFRLELINHGAPKLLVRAGLDQVRLHVSVLAADRMVMDRLTTELPGRLGRADLRTIRVTWDPGELIRKKRIRTLSIDRLHLNLRPTDDGSGTAGLPDLVAIRRQIKEVAARLPLERLVVRDLTVTGPHLAHLPAHLNLSAERKKDGRLYIRIEEGRSRAVLSAHLGGGDQRPWTIRVSRPDNDHDILALALDPALNLEIQADLARTGRLVNLLGLPWPGLSGTVRLRLSSLSSGTHRLQADGDLLRWNSLTADRFRLSLEVDAGKGRWTLASGARMHLERISGPSLAAALIDTVFQGDLTIAGGETRLASGTGSRIMIRNLVLDKTRADELVLRPVLTLKAGQGPVDIVLAPETTLTARMFTLSSFRAQTIRIQPMRSVHLRGRGRSWTTEATALQLHLPSLSMGQARLTCTPLNIDFGPCHLGGGRFSLVSEARLDTLTLQSGERSLRLGDLHGSLRGNQDLLKGRLTLSPAPLTGRIVTSFQAQPDQGSIKAELSGHDLTLSPETPLSALLHPWPLPGDLQGGVLSLAGHLRAGRNRPPELRIRLDLDQGQGRIKDYPLSGVSLHQDLQILPRLRSLSPGTLSIDAINTPVLLERLQATFSLVPGPSKTMPLIRLDQAGLDLFGGRIRTDPLTVDPSEPEMELTLRLHDIDLSQVLALHQVKGLSVSGRISGELPLSYHAHRLRIDRGTLYNSGPGGTIRYQPEQENGLNTSPLTGYALKALEEFHYSLLKAGVDYRPDGTLKADFHLEGKSPKLSTRRSVHLNIATEQNLLSLLKSLRYSERIDREISRKAEEFSHRPQP